MSSNGALPQTLKSITATKISELSKQRALFEKRRNEILQAAEAAPDTHAKVQVLLEGVCRLQGFPRDAFDKDDIDEDLESESSVPDDSERAVHANIRRFLFQSRHDPSVSERILKESVDHLEKELQHLEVKHKHASFYSNLVTEWLLDLEGEQASRNPGFEQVGRAEMHEQRATWESLVFNAADVDSDALRTYLDGLFATTNLSRQALKELRERIKSFGNDFTPMPDLFLVSDLQWVARASLKTDLLSKEKTAVLKEFMRNDEVAQEVADVLNMRLASLDSWSWDAEGIPVEMRWQLNGKYRVFMDEDLLDSLLIQYLGVKWSIAFRRAFVAFLNSPAWKSLHEDISKQERERRQYFVDGTADCVNDRRRRTYKDDYFMAQLPDSECEAVRAYYEEEDEEVVADARMNPLKTKHSLLHLLITESLIHKDLHGQFTAIRSDFKWFGPSLPHSTILGVLAYFGVPENWLNFFKTFLEAPLKFVQDGPNATAQIRKRGVPMSHALSDCFGETVLFSMDFAVNQATDGAHLYRLHDDFWFWGREATCIEAWKAMTEFSKVMGLEFNVEKTGTVRLYRKAGEKGYRPSEEAASPGSSNGQDKHPSTSSTSESDLLPVGDIRWGFLKLDPEEGRFIIDQEQVDAHISELKHQLASCKSIFSWVQAWNSYFSRFFTNNFAKPAMCFGRSHIDMAVSTLSRIERTLFPSANNSDHSGVTDYLRQVIAERFDVHDLPDGFFYFPVELGGLELLNPFIPLLAMRENIKQTPQRRLQKAFVQDETTYHAEKQRYETHGPRNPQAISAVGDEPAAFLSLDEYTKYPESHSRALLLAYMDLTRVPDEVGVARTVNFYNSQRRLDTHFGGNKIISAHWRGMSPYWRWTGELYYPEMVRKYGGLAAVTREFMPLGVVKTLKEGKFRWQG